MAGTEAADVSYMEMASAITVTSFAAAMSPLPTGGNIITSSNFASKETTSEELNKIFKFLFLLPVANVLLNDFLAASACPTSTAFYGLFG